MGRPRKYLPHGSVVFVTMSLEQGLLLLANPLCEQILRSALARAQNLHPVRNCHLIVEGTHIHLVIVVIGPDDAAHFIGHFKAEVAHRFNTLMGWAKRTVWCEGYDSPVILTPERALIAIAYLYANPAKDNLEDSIDSYPGFSTWKMYQSGNYSRKWKFVRRPAYRYLNDDMHSPAGYQREASRIEKENRPILEFSIEPDAWLEAFGINDKEKKAEWNARLLQRVRTLEARARRRRTLQRKRVIGAHALRSQRLTLNYMPRRSGKRTWCLSEKRSERIRFIDSLKELIAKSREVLSRWRSGDFSVPYPPGLFPPSMPKLIEPLCRC